MLALNPPWVSVGSSRLSEGLIVLFSLFCLFLPDPGQSLCFSGNWGFLTLSLKLLPLLPCGWPTPPATSTPSPLTSTPSQLSSSSRALFLCLLLWAAIRIHSLSASGAFFETLTQLFSSLCWSLFLNSFINDTKPQKEDPDSGNVTYSFGNTAEALQHTTGDQDSRTLDKLF